MKNLKFTFFFFLFILATPQLSHAQFFVDAGINYGTSALSRYGDNITSGSLGINGSIGIEFNETLRIIARYTVYLDQTESAYFDEYDLFLTYQFLNKREIIKPYVMTGLNYWEMGYLDQDYNYFKRKVLALNIGMGTNFDNGGRFVPFCELKVHLFNRYNKSYTIGGGVRYYL